MVVILFRPSFCRFSTSFHRLAEQVSDKERFITKTEVSRFMTECMVKVGTPLSNAEMLADNLMQADYRGHFSHGLNRLSLYVNDVLSKTCDPAAEPRVITETCSTALVDGKDSLGVVVGNYCMNLAINKAKETGIGWISAKGSNHFGICQWHAEKALKHNFIGLTFTNTSPLLTPTRSKSATFGTNPICIVAPGLNGDSLVLDMSTTTVAVGKIEMQMRKKEKLPSKSWALDRNGHPTLDPQEAFFEGCGLLPLGGAEINSGYKGYGLAMMVEVFCGLLSGSHFGPSIRKWTEADRSADLGQCFAAIDPERFAPDFQTRLQELMTLIRNLPSVDPDSRSVLIPGDPERAHRRKVDSEGALFYTVDHITSYRSLAKELNVMPMQHYEV